MDADSWIAIAGAVVALISLVLAFLARRDAKNDAADAKTDAAAAGQRASEANDSARRSAEAAERVAKVQEDQAAVDKAEREQYRPPWRLTWSSSDTYLLTNNSAEDLYFVTVEGDPIGDRLQFDHIGQFSGRTFLAAMTFDTVSDLVLVTWKRSPDGEEFHWNRPLPGRG